MEKGLWKPNNSDHHHHHNQAIVTPTCPRCGSSNTKFCYYNNYSLTQPRYFCKGCRRYWTRGGSLRNVPIGGGCRKSRRGKSIRISTDAKTLGHNGIESSTGSLSAVSRSHAAVSNSTSNIDLAQVYANFLNPKTNQVELRTSLPELPDGIVSVTPSFDQFPGFHDQLMMSSHLPDHQGISAGFIDQCGIVMPSIESSIGFNGINSIVKDRFASDGNFFSSLNSTYSFALPPLPDVVVSEGLLWPSSHVILSNQMLHSTAHPTTRVVELPAGQNSEVLNASNNIVNPFSPLSLEAIFRS